MCTICRSVDVEVDNVDPSYKTVVEMNKSDLNCIIRILEQL